MTTSNGSNLATLYAFALSLIVCSHINYGMFAWTGFWAVYAYRYMSKPRNRGDELTNGEGSSE